MRIDLVGAEFEENLALRSIRAAPAGPTRPGFGRRRRTSRAPTELDPRASLPRRRR